MDRLYARSELWSFRDIETIASEWCECQRESKDHIEETKKMKLFHMFLVSLRPLMYLIE
jgi:hypothetical protein